MLVSYKWLKEYLDGDISYQLSDIKEVDYISNVLNTRSFEVESVEEKGDDFIFDIKITPNRAHDCLCHTGVAREIAINCNLKFKALDPKKEEGSFNTNFEVEITDPRCLRYMLREIKNVEVGESHPDLRNKMESIGEKSINNVVDITNIVLFELGQPMHAFDKAKLSGNKISARSSVIGETLTTLDNNFVEFDNDTCVIADTEPLAIAGIKGGKKAEVDSHTTGLILESANFNAGEIRKTSNKIGIGTESSKRYENGITPELTEIAMNRATELLIKYGGAKVEVSNIVDVYPEKIKPHYVEASLLQINNLLGLNLSVDDVRDIFDRLEFEYEYSNNEKFVVRVPDLRLDIIKSVDLIEEVGRIYGYEKIESKPVEGLVPVKNSNQEASVILKIKSVLQELGFSEVYTYSFEDNGDIQIKKALAKDKDYMRTSLKVGIEKALTLGHYNADLIAIDRIQIFEIGKVFPKGVETLVLGLGVKNKNFKKPKTNDILSETLLKLSEKLSVKFESEIKEGDEFLQIDLTNLINQIKIDEEIKIDFDSNKKFKPLSQYPFMSRDISVWITNGKGNEETIFEIVEKYAGELLRTKRLFDVFEKDGRTSYAVRVVFQSNEKTLNDVEVGEIMDKVYDELKSKEGFEIR